MINYQTLNINPLTKLSFRAQSRLAPWCFPLALQNDAPLPVGVFPIITVNSQGKSSLLVLTPEEQPTTIEKFFPKTTLGNRFRESLQNTHLWLETQLPIWIKNQSPLHPFLYCIYTDAKEVPKRVNGHSAGLSLLLIQLSFLLKHPLPKNLICSIALKQTGELGPVDGLKEKIKTIVQQAPIIQTIFVHSEQKEKAQKILDSLQLKPKIQILAFETVKEVLENIILPTNDKTITETLELELQNQNPSLFLNFLFLRVLKGKSQIFGWRSLAKTLQLFRIQHGDKLSEHDLKMLKLLQLISDRYAGTHFLKLKFNKEDFEWVLQFPLATNLEILAHLIQQLASKPRKLDREAREKILEQAKKRLPPPEDEIIAAPFLRILGAYGRYERSRKQKDDAFKKQLQAFHGWINNSVDQEASYPLCELLELAGEMNTPNVHTQAKNCYNLLNSRPNGILPHNRGYILCAEMTRRHANKENWEEIAKILLAEFSPFPQDLKKNARRKINDWGPENPSPPF